MERKTTFYGTPLNRSLVVDQASSGGPVNSRRARLNQQETIRDAQGRQRFHGAFTGGFSAGYYNTVDSVEGFQPRQFVTHRNAKGARHVGDNVPFSHKPEDYMDDEDLGEFGIAPKKLRVSEQYSRIVDPFARLHHGLQSTLANILEPRESIGERILRQLGAIESRSRILVSGIEYGKYDHHDAKNNFHGLGYKPLEAKSNTLSMRCKSVNPLTAVLGEGRRLLISGEAFGTGVLDDDEDIVETSDAYGYEDIRNYKFPTKTSLLNTRTVHPGTGYVSASNSDNELAGFHLAAIESCDIEINHPPISVPEHWQRPKRLEIYNPIAGPSTSGRMLILQNSQYGGPVNSIFQKKFILGSESLKSNDLETKAGLVDYSDLKSVKEKAQIKPKPDGHIETVEATIDRQELTWRPCSLLCKRFNVPDPYPNNKFEEGPPSTSQTEIELSFAQPDTSERLNEIRCFNSRPASLELKRSIFDVKFTNPPDPDENISDCDSDDKDEDRPQILDPDEIVLPQHIDTTHQTKEEEEDVEIVTAPPQKPEIICLSSSSSSSSSTPVVDVSGARLCTQSLSEADTDSYGPPLPPTMGALFRLDHRSISRPKSSKSRQRKYKKHGKHKRNSDRS